MKKILVSFCVLFLISTSAVFAESSQNDGMEYFFDTGKLSMFAGPYTRLRFINNTLVMGMGGGGIICWDHRYYIYGQMTTYDSNVPNNNEIEMGLVNYGATVGYIFFPQNKIHFSAGVQFADNNIIFRQSDGLKLNHDINFFSIAPEVNVEANILEYLRIYLGAGWHFAITDGDYFDINRKTLSGFSINWGFLMGKF
ncbi:MAG: porin family protein [Chitinispirillales bacterium]|jgi:hypothetical protein|nr:porin family protein [Chitinispirillales bacterium]